MKNLNDLLPSYLKATHKKPVKAEPKRATRAEAIRELGKGRKKSKKTPINGAAITTEGNEYFSDEDSCPKTSVALDSPHTCKKSSISKHNGQYSATTA